MKKVALIYSANLSNPTGASAIIRNFADSRAIFKENGIELSIYAPDVLNQDEKISVQKETKKGFYGRSAVMVSSFGVNYAIGAVIRLLVPYLRSTIVKDYLKKKPKDDVVFFHELFTCYKYLKKRKNNKAKVVLVVHNDGDTYKMLRTEYKTLEKSIFYKYLLKIEQYVLENIDMLGFSADYPCRNFMEIHPEFDKNKIFYVYNGLSVSPLKKNLATNNSDVYEICCVGTVMERKGQRFIVEALHKMNVSSSIPNVHFSIVGGGPLKNELETLAAQYGVSKYITFHGSTSQVNKYLENSDLFILPSITEGFPIAILEAMRLGLPIVSTNVAGIPEMINDGQTGIIIEPSVEGVFGFLSSFDKYDWKKMGENSRKLFLEKFTTEKMMRSYSAVLKSV
ncbi:glycosyltransferase family 4 protein [Paucihalobacter ruber]|uniref:Glycosyltransferase family 4 protein n=1 Tax=Paucihalobacter ruber TaxID=2567861 RepID=A0A506PRT1_9FLAO|nr:glycosyltransferase family 4 protein [Paucihalobacter ruber]TPV35972.1 glycosyltransferase family 4 protein [Paucihalobacter ruber]